MARLRFQAGPPVYQGDDQGRSLRVRRGDVVEVSDGKRDQLLRDFPGWFEDDKPKPRQGKRSTTEA